MSLGAPADDPATAPLTEAAERLWADGITVVAAAGDDGGVDAPGMDPYVLTVGAVDGAGQVPARSSRGPDFAGRAKPDREPTAWPGPPPRPGATGPTTAHPR